MPRRVTVVLPHQGARPTPVAPLIFHKSWKISPEKANVTNYKSTSKMVLSHYANPALEASLPENSTLQDKGAFLIIENNIYRVYLYLALLLIIIACAPYLLS